MTRLSIKIFAVNDYEYIAGHDQQSCLEWYIDECNLGAYEFEARRDIVELTDEEMDELTFQDDDGTERSFREQLALLISRGETFPMYFAGPV